MVMMLAIVAATLLGTATETTIAANHRDAIQTLYAAEAGIELTMSRLRTMPDWSQFASQTPGTLFLGGPLADLLQSDGIDGRVQVAVSVFPGPDGAPDVLVLQSTASAPGGSRREVQVTIRRAAPAEDGAQNIETVFWRER